MVESKEALWKRWNYNSKHKLTETRKVIGTAHCDTDIRLALNISKSNSRKDKSYYVKLRSLTPGHLKIVEVRSS